MRKQNKIISLILVVAMLLSMLVILPVGATAAGEGESETFVPTATAVEMDGSFSDSIFASTKNNKVYSLSAANWDANVLSKYVWTEAGGNKYVSLSTLASNSTGNHYFNVTAGEPTVDEQKLSFTKQEDGTVVASGYYVIEFDYASEAGFPSSFFVRPNIGYVGAGSYTQRLDPDPSQKSTFAQDVGAADGNWHHYTMVGDLANNVIYIYVDGAFVHEVGSAFVPNSAPDYTKNYYVASFRVEVGKNKTIGKDNTLNLDNFAVRSFAKDTSLAAALEAKDLKKWDKNVVCTSGSLPVLAKIGETEYTTVSALNTAIAASDTALTVDMQRTFKGILTVSDTVNFNTNGVCEESVLVAANGVNKKVDGNTVKFFKKSMTVSETGNPFVITKYNATDNLLTGVGFNNIGNGNNNTVKDRTEAKNLYVTNNLTGDTYVRWDVTVADPTNTFAGLNSNTVITYDSGVSQYMVYDFDLAYLSGGESFNVTSVCRDASDTGLWGYNTGGKFGEITAKWTPGTFHHVTVVMNYQTNDMIIYVDNAVVMTIANGVMNADYYKDTWKTANGNTVKQEGLRLGQNQTQNVAIDNTYVRHIKDDASLASAIAAKDLSKWDKTVLTNDYDMPECAPVATVDGEYVCTGAQLAEKVNRYGNHQVEVLYDIAEELTITGNAVIDTHGIGANLVPGLNTSKTEGITDATFTGPWQASATTNDIKNTGSSLDMLSAVGVSGVNNISHAVDLSPRVNLTVVTDGATGNQYIDFRSISGPATTAHNYIDIETKAHAYTKDTFTVIDFDASFESELLGEMYIQINSRTSAGANGTKNGFVNQWGLTAGEWAHVTIVCDINNNVMYYYVNNTRKATVKDSIYTGSVNEDGNVVDANKNQISFHTLRVNLNVSNYLNKNQNFALDNVKITHGVSDEWLLANSGAASLSAWENRTYNESYKLPNVPTIAVVDGVEYKTVADAEAALAVGEAHLVSLDREFKGTLKVASEATVAKHGLTNTVEAVPGFYVEADNGNSTVSIIKYKTTGNVSVMINGNEAIRVNLPYGTDFAKYLSENHVNLGGVIVAGDKVYTDATWDKAPGIVNADNTTYSVTAKEFAGDFLVLNGDTGDTVTADTFVAALTNTTANKIIVLNKDVKIGTVKVAIKASNTIYMLGHTVGFESTATGDHAFTVDKNTGIVTFIGGTIIDDVRNNSHNLFYASYDFSREIKLLGCQVYGIAHIASMRGGTFTVQNSVLTVPMYQSTNPFEVAEYYNGFSYNKATLNLIDSKIKYTTINSDVTAAFITVKDIDTWLKGATPEDREKVIETCADTLVHEVNISGCSVWIPNQTALLTTNQCLDGVANVKFNIDNTELHVKNLHTNTYNTVTIGEGVKSAAALTGVNFAEGVEKVNSGNAMLPHAYSARYATVTWSDGTTEKWADGSTPVNADCKSDNVRQVVAGETVTFTNSGFAPALKANMTLGANLIFNLYVPVANAQNITRVIINGSTYEIIPGFTEVVQVANADHYLFQHLMNPEVAAQTFTIVVENANGDTVSKNMSIAQYASRAEEADPNSADLVRSLLAYVAEAHKYTGTYVDGFDAVDGYDDAAAVALPTKGTNEMSNLSEYITSAQLNLSYGPKWRFNIADGADITGLKVKVGDTEVAYTTGNGYIEVELPAYEMGKVITISVAEGTITGSYDLAAYCAAQAASAASITLSSNRLLKGDIKAARALESLNLLKAFYTYVNYAAAYKA